jgi:hypothetical protein
MKWTIAATILASISSTSAFVSSNALQRSTSSLTTADGAGLAFVKDTVRSKLYHTRRDMVSVSTDVDYDVVKVDLSDGRDYPIYIGANFEEEEGE